MNGPENPARWLPDPTGRHEHRYWNGSSWSDDVADKGVTGKDAVSGEAVAGAPTQEGDAGEKMGVAGVAPGVTEGEAPTAPSDAPVAATTAAAASAALSGNKKGFGAFVSKSWHAFRR